MTLVIEHMSILLAEEVCGSWMFPSCMGSQYIVRCSDLLLPYCYIDCVISLRGQKKGECSHVPHARMSAQRSLGQI
jgi:hypothetical protein